MARYTIDFAEDFDTFLSNLASAEGTTKSELIRRALAYYSFIRNETLKGPGHKVSITNQDDVVLKDIVVPYWKLTVDTNKSGI